MTGSTDNFVAIRFTLLNTGLTPTSPIYAAFDNIYIEASTTDVISGITEHAHAPMNIWPNPATDRVTIEDLVSGTPVEFFTLAGQRVAVRIAQQNAAIDVSGFAPGTYVIRARADRCAMPDSSSGRTPQECCRSSHGARHLFAAL